MSNGERKKRKKKKKRGIYVYNRNSGVSCGDFAAREGERGGSGSQPRNWRKTVANLQARIPRSQQCVILLKRGGTRDIGASVSEVQMENETITQRTLRRDRSARGNGVGKKISRDRYARVSDAFSVHFGGIRSRIGFSSLRREERDATIHLRIASIKFGLMKAHCAMFPNLFSLETDAYLVVYLFLRIMTTRNEYYTRMKN